MSSCDQMSNFLLIVELALWCLRRQYWFVPSTTIASAWVTSSQSSSGLACYCQRRPATTDSYLAGSVESTPPPPHPSTANFEHKQSKTTVWKLLQICCISLSERGNGWVDHIMKFALSVFADDSFVFNSAKLNTKQNIQTVGILNGKTQMLNISSQRLWLRSVLT